MADGFENNNFENENVTPNINANENPTDTPAINYSESNSSYPETQNQNTNDTTYNYSYVNPRNEQPNRNTYEYRWNYSEGGNKSSFDNSSPKKKRDSFKIFMGAVAGVFVLSFAAFTTVMTLNYINRNTSYPMNTDTGVTEEKTSPTLTIPEASSDSKDSLTISQIAAKCQPSAVGVVADYEVSYDYGFFFGGTQTYNAESQGSGFILNKDGYIVTNYHVVQDGKNYTVVLNDGTELEAEFVGGDALTDIAVLKVDYDGLVPMEIGNSDTLAVGDLAVAIGCPAGIQFAGTVTDGIISAINRDIEITDSYGRVQKTMTLIQTNATINKGNSGGALINSKGQVIGINTLKLTSEYEGIGFAIPINGAVDIINQLIENGEVSDRNTDSSFVVSPGSIGITNYAEITKSESEYYGIPRGIQVIQIKKDSSAAAAGLRRGDIIVAYNGKEVTSVATLNSLKAKDKAGDEVTLTVYREAEGNVDITFKLDQAE